MRSRKFIFTKNNYAEKDIEDLPTGLEPFRYLVFGKEVAPTTGTPHLQGFVYFSNARTVNSVRRKMDGCHVEVARGTSKQCRDYCIKDGDFYEFGEIPDDDGDRGSAEKERFSVAWDLAKGGRVDEIDADIRVRYYSALRRIEKDYMPRVEGLPGVCGLWIHGESGAGKTRAVLSTYPDAFIKPRNNWWDGYQDETIVLIDDLDVYDVQLGGKLKHWADFAPFVAETKGSARRIRPVKCIVTSQYTIEEIWNDPKTVAALKRRFTIVEKFKDQNIII